MLFENLHLIQNILLSNGGVKQYKSGHLACFTTCWDGNTLLSEKQFKSQTCIKCLSTFLCNKILEVGHCCEVKVYMFSLHGHEEKPEM